MKNIGTCEMCGAQGFLLRAEIEGTQLNVCKRCAKFGKVYGKVRQKSQAAKPKQRMPEPKRDEEEIVVDDYSNLVKFHREKRGLTQEDLAKKLSEKESVIHKIESRQFKPSLGLAKKIGKFFNIKLTETYEESHEYKTEKTPGSLTIGDSIKIRKRS